MTATVSFQPFAQTAGNNGLFNVKSDGLRQGTAFADPATRYRLRAGLLATTETLPMWGGVAVYADVPGSPTGGLTNPNTALGTIVGRALSLTDANKPLNGFSVFDEAYAMVTSPQSTVPLAASGQQVNWYPLGSLARVAVQCDPALIDLRGGPINQNVSWDFTNQLLVPYLGTLTINSYAYNSTTGIVTLTMASAVTFDGGDSITVAGLNIAGLNGTFTALTASGTTVTYQAATGVAGSPSGGGTLTVGGAANAALNVKVLDVVASNCEVVTYAATTGFATWNYNGAAAVIQI